MDKKHIERLRKSKRIIGEITPVIVDSDGEILAGVYRKEAGWLRTHKVDTKTQAEKRRLPRQVMKEMIKISSNIQRKVSKEETRASFLTMAEAFEREGVPKEKIASEVAKCVPYTHQYVLELLPDGYKQIKKAVSPGRPVSVKPSLTKVKPKVESHVYKAEETWEQRKAVMSPPVSKMDESVLLELNQRGVYPEAQKKVCIIELTVDHWFELPDRPLAVFLDGPVHKGREDRDIANRELLAKRGVEVLEISYERPTKEEAEAIVEKIMAALQERGLKF